MDEKINEHAPPICTHYQQILCLTFVFRNVHFSTRSDMWISCYSNISMISLQITIRLKILKHILGLPHVTSLVFLPFFNVSLTAFLAVSALVSPSNSCFLLFMHLSPIPSFSLTVGSQIIRRHDLSWKLSRFVILVFINEPIMANKILLLWKSEAFRPASRIANLQ